MKKYINQIRSSALTAIIVVSLYLLPASSLQAEQDRTIVVGILPYLSPITLLKVYEPLRKHLSESLDYDVTLETAPNFARFKGDTEKGKYDIVLTAPHFVPGALDSGYYRVTATTINSLSAVLVTRSDSPVQDISDFINPVIATPPEKAIITIIGKQHFSKAGLKPSYYLPYNTHNSAYHAVLRHKADAAIISINVYHKAIMDKKPIRIISQSKAFPGVGFLTATKLPAELQDRIQQSLLSLDKTPEGQDFLQRSTYPGLRPATPELYAPFRDILDN
jgi:phosphonate transport system substrate-binding protein